MQRDGCTDKTRQDKTREDKTRQNKTRQDKTRQDKTEKRGEVNKHIFTTFRCEVKQRCSCTRHERIHGEQRYSSTHSQPRRKMEVGGQYDVPATLLSGNNPGTHLIRGG
jgi:hypothetical protein